jgi:protein-tyrosine phosphatase
MLSEVRPWLHVTDIETAREADTSDFASVITVCQENIRDNVSRDTYYSYFNMCDGPDNEYGGYSDYGIFCDAVDAVLQARRPVLVHCHVGRSRSVTVAAAALGADEGLSWENALSAVRNARGDVNPDNLLVEYLQTYLS